ncbi:MAG: MoaD/ThiS family protein [Rhodospirillales bacterium]|nr:MoaD/ThiS family protein [Rhodospirillales bacterium]
MKITVKLFALLGRYLPPGAKESTAEIDIDDGATSADVIRRLNLPVHYCHLVLVNGNFVPPSERESCVLKDDDVLAIWPPVAGG